MITRHSIFIKITPTCFLNQTEKAARHKAIRKRFRFKPKPTAAAQQFRTNESIRIPKVMVIDENGVQLGEMYTSEALSMARERELDLVEVSPKAQPPVCRIMDYGKQQYKQSKQQRLAKAKQKTVETKGVRMGLRTDAHDLDNKKNQIEKFLRKGNKVKIDIILKGREKAHQDLARDNMKKFLTLIETPYKIEEDIKRFPGGFNVIIAPIQETQE
ncbi:MAG TPA: translation initiation factor IF-3 [Candidatus Moranbacteria bacterium]|nr:MAG: Translation initiation factor IF-3 [Candidatus Moranbacteria bacterium GW2011_GWC2_45_10]KKT95098.1 MAG: translation initiation factor IF-3, translation initiation factor IF-3 [Parcubacteria group bacterium GW2011_GWC1_45_14]HAV11271.1 translation initiation factor IF-3 [Candidatus Moranbacteria bacterium]